MKPVDKDEPRAVTAEEAASWFVINRSETASADDRAAFVAWLRESPVNVREYLAISAMARDLGKAVEMSPVDAATLVDQGCRADDDNVLVLTGHKVSGQASKQAPGQAPGRFSWSRQRLAAAASVAIIGLLAILWALNDAGMAAFPRIYRTEHGEQRTVQLADGSVLHLNSDSEVKIRFSKTERRVELEYGQALYEVAHEPARRFRVVAGELSVVAVGTQFDVYRQATGTVVSVVEGKVAVIPTSSKLTSGAGEAAAIAVAAGQQIRFDSQAFLPTMGSTLDQSRLVQPAESPKDVQAAVAWVQRQIIFDQKSLNEIADEFNRYGQIPIEIADPVLGRMRVSGILNAYDTEAFVRFLQRLEGVAVEQTPDRISVTQRRLEDASESAQQP